MRRAIATALIIALLSACASLPTDHLMVERGAGLQPGFAAYRVRGLIFELPDAWEAGRFARYVFWHDPVACRAYDFTGTRIGTANRDQASAVCCPWAAIHIYAMNQDRCQLWLDFASKPDPRAPYSDMRAAQASLGGQPFVRIDETLDRGDERMLVTGFYACRGGEAWSLELRAPVAQRDRHAEAVARVLASAEWEATASTGPEKRP
jgi:hypothetical protein